MERYTGSEIQNDFGILPDLMQTFFRNYDATLGRWTGIDPQTESAESLTVYNYSGNNPIMFNDPMGNSYAAPGHSREQFAKDFPFGEYEANSFDESSGGAAGYNSNGFQSLDAFLNEVNHLYDGFNYSNPNTIPGSITLYKAGVNDVSVIQNLFNLFKNGGEIEFNNGYWKSTYNNSYTDASGTALVGSSGILDYGKYKVNASQGGESTLSKIWNSDIARAIVPDMIGVNVSMNFSLGIGVSFTLQGSILTRGKDAGAYATGGYSVRAGWEAGASVNGVRGWYNGDSRNANINSLLGRGIDASANVGPAGFGVWGSLSNANRVSWFGSSGGIGFGIGASGGYGTTTLLGGFKF